MSTDVWTRADIIAYAARYGLKLETDEIDRMIALGTKVAATAARVQRMSSKGHEPASIFRVPL